MQWGESVEGEGDWRQMGEKKTGCRLLQDVLSEGGVCDLVTLEFCSVFLNQGW